MNCSKHTPISPRLLLTPVLALLVLAGSTAARAQDAPAPKSRGWLARLFSHPAPPAAGQGVRGSSVMARQSTAPQPATPPQTAPPQTTPPQTTPSQTAPPQTTPPQTTQQPAAPASPPSPEQQPRPAAAAPQDDTTYVIKTNVNEVDLFFTVTDKKGRFVTGLKQENFGLLDDGRPPVRVVRFQQQTQLPLRVGIMLDTSSSIRQRFEFEQQAATDFFLQVLHRNDRAFIEGFDIQINLPQDFTNNVDLLDTGIHKLRPGGGTALFDALYTTCKNQMLTLQEEGSVRKAIVLVSDGEDNYSRSTEQDAIKMCQRAETLVYTISTDTSPSKGRGGAVLERIAEATGGFAFNPQRLEDVSVGFKTIEEELRSQYSLLYTPAEFKQDGSFRTIYLQATDSRYHVRAKKGYFAPRPAQ